MRLLFATALSALSLVVFFAATGMALGVAWVPGWAGIDAQAFALPAEPGLTVRAARRCQYCGWIEWKREIPPSAAAPHALRTYEYTVEMADGSSRVFREALPVSWRVGERLLFIDGDGAGPLSALAGSRKN